ncbi:MAG TPA: molybdenum ABC transporter ATP-binding protein [Thermoanaerobaculia bacterium]|nr:molybdenum ABC transporter ATP-binding protein [Thermoanaerobaculia bacterium]
MIAVDIRLPLATFVLEVACAFESRVTAIVGPSGAGKTSLLEAIAGLRPKTAGRVVIGDHVAHDSIRGIFVPPERRRVGYVPQEGALFPHLDVRRNLLFGGRDLERLKALSKILEIEQLFDRFPAVLSGGERQRVALGRALMTSPRLLLLDEPLAALHQPLKEKLLVYLRRIREEMNVPIIYVTHHPVEAMALADEAVMLENGRVTMRGPAAEVVRRRTVAGDEAVENVIEVDGPLHDPAAGITRVTTREGVILSLPYDETAGLEFPIVVRISGDDMVLFTSEPKALSARNVLEGTIERLEERDGRVHLLVTTPTPLAVRLTTAAVHQLALKRGDRVWLAVRTLSFRILG